MVGQQNVQVKALDNSKVIKCIAHTENGTRHCGVGWSQIFQKYITSIVCYVFIIFNLKI
jgi:hypothetical protein